MLRPHQHTIKNRQAVLRVEGDEEATPSHLVAPTAATKDEIEAPLVDTSREEEKARRRAKLDAIWKEMNQPIPRKRTVGDEWTP